MTQVFNEDVFFNNGSQTFGNAFVSGDLTVDNAISSRSIVGANIISNGISITGVVTTSDLLNSSSRLTVGTGITAGSGIVTATNGFHSGIGTAVKITTFGNRVFFTVAGVGITSLQLY